VGRHAGTHKAPASSDPGPRRRRRDPGRSRRGESTGHPGLIALLTAGVLVASVVALVVRQNDGDLPPSARAAALADSTRHSQPDRSADRSAPRTYAVQGGVSLKPVHPAFYALSLRMEKRGFVFQRSAKGLPTAFTVSSFNVLGAGHTAGKGGLAPGPARMHAAVGLLLGHDVSVAGLQEFQDSQYRTFLALAGGTYDAYPGPSLGAQPVQNSIIWKQADWSLVEAHTVAIPYFHGNRVPMPYVLLRNLHSGREVWFYNSHNPADAHGPAAHWRAVATSIEASLVRNLTADGTPMIVTGDMNDREPFACPFASGTGMHSADGAYYSGGCHLPQHTNVDWIFGSAGLDFFGFVTDRSSQTRHISDHPMVRSQVVVPAGNDPRCRKALSFGWFCPAG
jgi:endonuclease/exonuclease/phosphatase family protein